MLGEKLPGFIIILLLFLSPIILSALDTVVLTENQGKYPLGLHFEYLEDKEGNLTIDDVVAPGYAGRFRRSVQEAPDFGYTRSPYWVRFRVRNTTRDSIRWLLKIDYCWFNTIEFFSPREDGSYTSKTSGYVVPIKKQDIKTNKHFFSFIVPRGGEETFYVRFKTTDLMILGMSIYSYDQLVKDDHEDQIINGLFYGAMIIMLIYNLFLFIFLSDRTYLYYVSMVFFIILVQLQDSGLYYEYIRPVTQGLLFFDPYYIIRGLLVLFSVLFGITFLQSKKFVPRLHTIAYWFMGYSGLFIIAGFFLPSSILDPVNSVMTIAAAFGGIVLGVACLIKGNTTAKFYLITFGSAVVCNILAGLSSYNILPFSTVLLDIDELGDLLMVVLLSIALAYRYRILKAEKELAESRTIEQTNFFINLSHEIKTPLTLISNYFQEYIDKHGMTGELQIIQKNLEKLLRDMVNFFDVLRFTRGKRPYDHSQVVDLSDYLEKQAALFERLSAKRGITLAVSVEKEVYIKADPSAVERILNNLFDNALRYNRDQGSIEVELKSVEDTIQFTVANTGAVIEEDQKKNIFTPYYQISRKKAGGQGIGMGLSIVKSVVDSLGGAIEVQDNDGDGAVFSVTLSRYFPGRNEPVARADAAAPLITLPEVRTEQAVKKPAEEKENTVLLVEDDRDLLYLMEEKVGERYHVETAENGAKALTLLEESGAPDVIVSDVMMDDMDGYRFLRAVQEVPGLREVPFIFVTARSTINEKIEGLKRGAIDFIYKPFVIEELISRIESILRYRAIQKEMHEKERFTSIGMMMGGVSHEIFNPLSGISGPLQNIRKIVDAGTIDQKEKLEKHLSFIKESITRIEQIVTTMRAIFQNRSLEKEDIALPGLLAPLVERYREETGERIIFTLTVDPAARVRGNPFVLTRILDNLIANCVDAIDERGEISIASENRGAGWILTITDTGKGIGKEEREKIFNAFYSLKERPDRSGLGLFIVRNLVSGMGWKIEVSSAPDKGTTFTLNPGDSV